MKFYRYLLMLFLAQPSFGMQIKDLLNPEIIPNHTNEQQGRESTHDETTEILDDDIEFIQENFDNDMHDNEIEIDRSDFNKKNVSNAAIASVIHELRTQAGKPQYQCNSCSYKVAFASTLVKHLRKHTGERPYQCPHCDYAATTSSNLNIHLRTHTGEKPYQCPRCDYAATTSSHLTRHLRRHRDEVQMPS